MARTDRRQSRITPTALLRQHPHHPGFVSYAKEQRQRPWQGRGVYGGFIWTHEAGFTRLRLGIRCGEHLAVA